MASKPRAVDLGPMYLQVGEESDSQGQPTPSDGADANDVVRFQSVLNRREGQKREPEPEPSPETLLNPLLRTEAADLADPEDLGREISHLWVGTGLTSAREVRVGLRESLLPDTSVRLLEVEGRLCIEFTCASSRVADWLDRKLALLARELGGRLQRPLELTVAMNSGIQIGSRAWTGQE